MCDMPKPKTLHKCMLIFESRSSEKFSDQVMLVKATASRLPPPPCPTLFEHNLSSEEEEEEERGPKSLKTEMRTNEFC